jgi:hypothetical protein
MGGVCYDGDEVALVYREGRVRVDEEHGRVTLECSDCGYRFRWGDEVFYEVWVSGTGTASVEASCAGCDQILEALWEAGAECLYRGHLDDYLDGDDEILLEATESVPLDERSPQLNARLARLVYQNGCIARGEDYDEDYDEDDDDGD